MTTSWRTVVLQLAVGCTFLVVLWNVVDGRAALQRLAGAEPQWLLLGWLALNLQTILSAMRWRMTAAALDMQIGKLRAIREYYVAHFVNQLLPGAILGDVGRAIRARPTDQRPASALARSGEAVIFERLAGQIALGLVLAAGIAFALLTPGGIGMPERCGIALAGLLAVALLVFALVAVSAHRRIAIFMRISANAHRALVGNGVWIGQIALGLAIVACNIAAFAFAARATGTALGFEAIVTIVPLVLFSMVVPLTISGWGFREGAAAGLFPLAGAPAEAGLAASVAFGLMILASALPGALWLWPRATARQFFSRRSAAELPPAPGALQSMKTGKTTK